MIKLAFGSVPKDGGTFTFFRNMRPSLLVHNIDMRSVTIGRKQAKLTEDAYITDGCVLLAPKERGIKKQARVFVDWCEQEGIDIVMGINSEAILSALPHLPERIRCMARCANSFEQGYRVTLSGAARLAAIIAQTPRQFSDLTGQYKVCSEAITVIPNGINPMPFRPMAAIRQNPSSHGILRLGFLGRIEHKQKGVLFLPRIVSEIQRRGIPFTLRVAGKGRHVSDLKEGIRKALEVRRPAEVAPHVSFEGPILPPDVPMFLAENDLLLFPSQFEGCPNVLLEAMMAGCLPLAWRIEGITDFLIDHKATGFLSCIGDVGGMVDWVEMLHHDRSQLVKIQRNTAAVAETRFTSAVASSAYAELLHAVMQRPAPKWTPRPWDDFQVDPNFRYNWKQRVRCKLGHFAKALLASC